MHFEHFSLNNILQGTVFHKTQHVGKIVLCIWGSFAKITMFKSMGCQICSRIFHFRSIEQCFQLLFTSLKKEFNHLIKARISFLCSHTFFKFDWDTDWTHEEEDGSIPGVFPRPGWAKHWGNPVWSHSWLCLEQGCIRDLLRSKIYVFSVNYNFPEKVFWSALASRFS